ncbi:hypothetical protein [Austwickia sp. TVS 96-490-7B]|uniref:hypothetical protein n=1 Tax=Austwickia sp. TVS 96-490-7B TaxID=2830843 RepID=UPI001C599E9E|nr:hypothetical protein [Austwickia sp. TVS 96-490-7B]
MPLTTPRTTHPGDGSTIGKPESAGGQPVHFFLSRATLTMAKLRELDGMLATRSL